MTYDLIHLLDKKVHLYQPEKGFRTSQDAVFLAAACPAKGKETVLDMGCGVGGATFCLLWRLPDLRISGIEIEKIYLTLAKKNADLNGASIDFIQGDVMQYRVNEPNLRYNHIICNPPYFDAEGHTPSPTLQTAAAKGYQHPDNSLEAWIKSAFDNLKSKGSLTLIHQAEKLDSILLFLGKKFGATEIIPIYSKKNEPAKRIIVRTYKDRKSPCLLHPDLIVHNEDLSFTKSADQLLRAGHSFETLWAGEK